MQVLVDQARRGRVGEQVGQGRERLLGEPARDERGRLRQLLAPPDRPPLQRVELGPGRPVEPGEQPADHLAGVEERHGGQVAVPVEALQEQGVCRGVGGQEPHRPVPVPQPQRQVLVPGLRVGPGELEDGLVPAPPDREHEGVLPVPRVAVDGEGPPVEVVVHQARQPVEPGVAVRVAGGLGGTAGHGTAEAVGDVEHRESR